MFRIKPMNVVNSAEKKITTRINELFDSFAIMSEEQKLNFLRENRGILSEIYFAKPDEYRRVVALYPIAELIDELKAPESPIYQVVGNFRPEIFLALFERVSPEQRWNILCRSNDTHNILSTLIENHQAGVYSGSIYKYGEHDVLTAMVLLPDPYFNELNQHIEALETAQEINAQKLANALRVLRDNLGKDVTRQEKNKKAPSEIQYSKAMQTLRETILMVREVRSMPAVDAMEAIKRYEQCSASKPSFLPKLIATVIFAAIGLVVGALVGLITSVSMGLGVLPLAVVGAALSGAVASAGLAAISGVNSALSKNSLFQPKLKPEANVAQSAREYIATP